MNVQPVVIAIVKIVGVMPTLRCLHCERLLSKKVFFGYQIVTVVGSSVPRPICTYCLRHYEKNKLVLQYHGKDL